MALVVGLVGLVCFTVLALAVLCAIYLKRYNDEMYKRLDKLFELSLSYQKAGSLGEKVRVDAEKQKLEIDLEAYKDAMIQAAAEPSVKEPIPAKTVDGREIDLRDWEVQ